MLWIDSVASDSPCTSGHSLSDPLGWMRLVTPGHAAAHRAAAPAVVQLERPHSAHGRAVLRVGAPEGMPVAAAVRAACDGPGEAVPRLACTSACGRTHTLRRATEALVTASAVAARLAEHIALPEAGGPSALYPNARARRAANNKYHHARAPPAAAASALKLSRGLSHARRGAHYQRRTHSQYIIIIGRGWSTLQEHYACVQVWLKVCMLLSCRRDVRTCTFNFHEQ